ncbi:hypothetical protein Nizo2741_2360 [Lactiplantibacillus plantarum]|nr:hypothetical protein Nizo2741_2360 [Lactiplantibacillus plantarum]
MTLGVINLKLLATFTLTRNYWRQMKLTNVAEVLGEYWTT